MNQSGPISYMLANERCILPKLSVITHTEQKNAVGAPFKSRLHSQAFVLRHHERNVLLTCICGGLRLEMRRPR